MTHFLVAALDKRRNFYQPPNQRVRKIKEEETSSEKGGSFGVTTHESFDFKDVWSFNHPHVSMKNFHEKVCQVEMLILKGEFRVFQEEE
jgi:hypothetical protein